MHLPPAGRVTPLRAAFVWMLALSGCHTGDSTAQGPTIGGSGSPDASTNPHLTSPASTSSAVALRDIRSHEFALEYAGYYGSKPSWLATQQHEGHCPGAGDGSEMLGRVMPEWSLEGWPEEHAALSLASLRGKVVVVRFWTAGCAFCEKSLPALQRLHSELADAPVVFVAAFHAKPVSSITTIDRPRAIAESWNITFPIAIDPDWKTLRSWWLAEGTHRHATSVTFVIDKAGKLAFVHPGPEFFPSDDPDNAEQNADYLALRQAIVTAAN